MKNWIVVLLIFTLPLGLYAYLEAKAQTDLMCKVEGNGTVTNPKAKIMKFSSPMCSECKEAQAELDKAMKNYKDAVIVEEINVVSSVGKDMDYAKKAIKEFKISLVPTLVFINKDGKVIKKHEGAMKSADITEVLDGINK